MELHVAIDIETLGKTTSSVVLSIGLAAVSLTTGLVTTKYCVLDMHEQANAGRDVDPGTMKWWEGQSAAAQQVISEAAGPNAIESDMAFVQIKEWLTFLQKNGGEVQGVWGYGSDFDNATLQNLWGQLPWGYKKNRCQRTLAALYPHISKPSVEGTVQHNALDDAVWQALYLRLLLLEHNRTGEKR